MLKLKLQYFGHLVRIVDSLEKTLMLGGIGGRRLRKVRWLSGQPQLYCTAPSLPGLACSGLEWIKQAVGKVPLICITSRQPCRTLC